MTNSKPLQLPKLNNFALELNFIPYILEEIWSIQCRLLFLGTLKMVDFQMGVAPSISEI